VSFLSTKNYPFKLIKDFYGYVCNRYTGDMMIPETQVKGYAALRDRINAISDSEVSF
jgi:hypothetical protein